MRSSTSGYCPPLSRSNIKSVDKAARPCKVARAGGGAGGRRMNLFTKALAGDVIPARLRQCRIAVGGWGDDLAASRRTQCVRRSSAAV